MDIRKEKRTEVSKMIYGYVRVSSRDQNEERQIIAMHEFGMPMSPRLRRKSSKYYAEQAEYPLTHLIAL